MFTRPGPVMDGWYRSSQKPQSHVAALPEKIAPGDWKQVLGRAWGASCNTWPRGFSYGMMVIHGE